MSGKKRRSFGGIMERNNRVVRTDFAGLLYARADETARRDLTQLIEHFDMDASDPEIRQMVHRTGFGGIIELRRALKRLGIAFLDGLPLIGPWFLRQFAAWKVTP